MTTSSLPNQAPRFSWYRDDIEARLGVRGGRFTRVNNILWFIAAAIVTVAIYAPIYILFPDGPLAILTERGYTQHAVILLATWSLLILLVKLTKTRVQRQAIEFRDLVPIESDFVLSPSTVGDVLGRLRGECDDPKRFLLFNRIELALSNLKNMGQIGDVDNVLQSQADNDEGAMESSYSLLRGLIWAIPVLGFIGTVYGLGRAIGKFGSLFAGGDGEALADLSRISDELPKVTGMLSVAFDTTLVALVAALVIQLLMTMTHKAEEELLDDCREYCQRNVISRLRLTAFGRL